MRTFIYQTIVGLVLSLSVATTIATAEEIVPPKPSPEQIAAAEAEAAAEVPTLIANVNFKGVSTSTEKSTAVAVFSLENSLGRQDGITYGVIFQSIKTGELLGSVTAPQHISLHEGEVKDLDFVYEVPNYLTQSAAVLLAAYNKEGLPLAFAQIDTVPAGTEAVTCSNVRDILQCAVPTLTNAEITIRSGSPQGEVVVSKLIQIDSNTGIELPLYTADLAPGRYVASVVLTNQDSGAVVGSYATDFTKDGEYGKLISVSPRMLEGGTLEVIVYAEVGYGVNGEPLQLTIDPGSCGEAKTVPYDAPVKTIRLETTCAGGVLSATLVSGSTVLDTSDASFGVAEEAAEEITDMVPTQTSETIPPASTAGALIAIVVGLLLLAVLVWYFVRRQSQTPTIPPVAALFLALVASSVVFMNHTAEAATYSIGGSVRYNTCVTTPGINCAEPDTLIGPTTSGSVTMPASVAQGSSYTVNFTIRTTTSNNTLCNSPNVACGLSNTITYVYDTLTGPGFGNVGMHFLSSYNTLPNGYHGSRSDISRPLIYSQSQGQSGSFTRTAPSSGTVDTLTFLTQPGGTGTPGPWIASCDPEWCLTYPLSLRNATTTLTAANVAPTANAGSDRTITLPTTSVAASGASATDSDGTIASRVWAFVSGPASPTISGGTTLTPTFNGLTAAGTYIFRLTVTDNNGATDTDTMSVSVFAAAPSCGWATTAYVGTNTGNPGLHNTVKCSTPAPSDATPNDAYCDSAGENGTTIVCCDTGADCYRYTCNYGGSCTPTPSLQLNFQ